MVEGGPEHPLLLLQDGRVGLLSPPVQMHPSGSGVAG